MPLGPLCLQQCFFDFPVSSLCRLHFLIFCWAEKTYHCFWRNSIFMTSSWRKKTWNNFYLMKQFLCWNGFLTFHSLPLSLSLHLNNHRDLRVTFPRLDLFTTQDYTFWIIENPRQRFSLCSSHQSQWSQICVTSLPKTVGSESQEKSAFTLFSSFSRTTRKLYVLPESTCIVDVKLKESFIVVWSHGVARANTYLSTFNYI